MSSLTRNELTNELTRDLIPTITQACEDDYQGDGECDDENNNEACGYDSGDCCSNSVQGGIVVKTYCDEVGCAGLPVTPFFFACVCGVCAFRCFLVIHFISQVIERTISIDRFLVQISAREPCLYAIAVIILGLFSCGFAVPLQRPGEYG